jgi:hypothetical protein
MMILILRLGEGRGALVMRRGVVRLVRGTRGVGVEVVDERREGRRRKTRPGGETGRMKKRVVVRRGGVEVEVEVEGRGIETEIEKRRRGGAGDRLGRE